MKKVKERFTTAKGVAYYPHISKPDQNYGGYKVNLCLSKEDAEPTIAVIKNVLTQGIQMDKALKKSITKQAPLPFKDEVGEDGVPTGNIIFKLKSGEDYKPAVFDSKNKAMINHNIWGGSIIKVGGTADYYNTNIGAGVTLRLNAVQIIEYVQGSDGADRFGFTEEEGFSFEDEFIEAVEREAEKDTGEPLPDEPVQLELPLDNPNQKPKLVQAVKPAQQVKPKPVEEPKPATSVGEADDLAAQIASLVNEASDD